MCTTDLPSVFDVLLGATPCAGAVSSAWYVVGWCFVAIIPIAIIAVIAGLIWIRDSMDAVTLTIVSLSTVAICAMVAYALSLPYTALAMWL